MKKIIDSQFEHAALEADIDRLAQEVRERRNLPEMQNADDKELVKAALKSLHKKDVEKEILTTNDENNSQGVNFLPAYMNDFSEESKLEVEYLLDLVAHKGLIYAHARAKKANPAVLDAFHDALAGKWHPELERRGVFR